MLDDGVVGSGSDIVWGRAYALLRLTLLEPAIIQSIHTGQQPWCMSLLGSSGTDCRATAWLTGVCSWGLPLIP